VCLLTLLLAYTGSVRREPSAGWDRGEFSRLRSEAYTHFQRGDYIEAARIYRAGYETAYALEDSYSALRFLNNFAGAHFASRKAQGSRGALRALNLA
jgi:hypothetical protein